MVECGCVFYVVDVVRFGLHKFDTWFEFMDPINIRLYFGGHFVTKNNKTTYERHPKVAPKDFGVALRLNVEEICYFEFVYWIKTDLGYKDVGEIWFRKRGCSLHNGRARVLSDKEIPEFLQAPESDGFYHLYLVQPDEDNDVRKLAYGPGVTFYTASKSSTVVGSGFDSGRDENGEGEMDKGESVDGKSGGDEKESDPLLYSKGGPQDNMGKNTILENPRSEINQKTHLLSFPNTEPIFFQVPTTTKQPQPKQALNTHFREKIPVVPTKKKLLATNFEQDSGDEEEGTGSDEDADGDSGQDKEAETDESDDD